MYNMYRALVCAPLLVAFVCGSTDMVAQPTDHRPRVLIVMGSVRQERIAEKMATAVMNLVDQFRIDAQVVDLADYALDSLKITDTPATNPGLGRWAQMLTSADAVVLLVPNYNEGVPGVLLQAINSVSSLWKNKPVAVVAYAGGFAGKSPINTLEHLFKRLGIRSLLDQTVYISFGQSSFDAEGAFKKKETSQAITTLLTTLHQAAVDTKESHEQN